MGWLIDVLKKVEYCLTGFHFLAAMEADGSTQILFS